MIFITISIISMGIAMWQYETLAYATEMAARYVSMHGATCAQNGNTCTITVGNVATFFTSQAMALNAGSVNVTLTDGSGATACNPVNTCTSSTTQFPNASNNSVGSDVTITATYTLKNPVTMFWPPAAIAANDYLAGARSRQAIVF
jgi:hypothetical protein